MSEEAESSRTRSKSMLEGARFGRHRESRPFGRAGEVEDKVRYKRVRAFQGKPR